MLMVRNAAIALAVFLGVVSGAAAQTKPAEKGGQAKPAAAQTKPSPPESYTAVTSKNMSPGAGTKLLIQILRWSSDEDREKVLSVIAGAPASAAPAPAPAAKAPEGEAAEQKKAGGAPPAPPDPVKALEGIATAGYVWSTGPLGYAVKYAHRTTTPDGGQRIVLVTDRPLGSWERPTWKIGGQGTTDTPYSVVELRLNAKGRGEGKVALAAPSGIDQQAKTIALTDYEKAPVLLQDVQRAPQGYSR
jgi:hypothetical protein